MLFSPYLARYSSSSCFVRGRQTVAKWDTETGQRVGNMLALEGLIQCVQVASEGGGGGGGGEGSSGDVLGGSAHGGAAGGGGAGYVAYAGSTSKRIYTVDTRDPMSVVSTWKCGSFVNSLHVYSDGGKVGIGAVTATSCVCVHMEAVGGGIKGYIYMYVDIFVSKHEGGAVSPKCWLFPFLCLCVCRCKYG